MFIRQTETNNQNMYMQMIAQNDTMQSLLFSRFHILQRIDMIMLCFSAKVNIVTLNKNASAYLCAILLNNFFINYITQSGAWWRHQMETFSALLAICAGNSPVSGEFPAQMPVTRSFDVFFDLRLNKRLSKQSWGWWFETLPRPLWRHSNERIVVTPIVFITVLHWRVSLIYQDPFYQRGLTLIPASISNSVPVRVWDEMN